MKFTTFSLVQAPSHIPDPEVVRNEADLMIFADELGFDAAWAAEHHFHHYCIDPDPLQLATYVAARTKKIRIGTAANVVTLIHPMRIAEQAAMLDCLSGGRVDIGFAKGYGPREFSGYGANIADGAERLKEAVDIILGAWTKENFTYKGKHFSVPYPVTLRPRPVQKPHPRAFIATGGTPDTLEFAASRGLSFYVSYQSRTHFQGLKKMYEDFARKAGKSETEIKRLTDQILVMQTSYVAPTEKQSYDDPKDAVAWMAKAVRSVNTPEDLDTWPEDQKKVVQARVATLAQGYENYDNYWKAFVYGDPGRAIERIQRLKDAGFENVIIGFSFGGLPYDKVRKSMRLFAEKVMPKFK